MKKLIMFSYLVLFVLLTTSCVKTNNIKKKIYQDDYIVDAAGERVYLLEDPTKATVVSSYAVVAPFLQALEITDRVLAINVKKYFTKQNDKYLKNASYCGAGIPDLEMLAKLNPTVYIHRSNDADSIRKVKELGIDCIQITVENMEDCKNTLLMLGKYFGVLDRANEVIEYIDSEFEFIDGVVENIDNSNKHTAICMGSELGRVSGADMIQSWMINKAGGVSLVEEYSDHDWINIGKEKICTYNPEYVFITSSSSKNYGISDFATKGLSTIAATINNNIYQIPAINDSWDMPGISPILGTLFMIRTMYPNLISDEEYNEHIDNYYTLMFGRTFTNVELGY